MPIFNSAKRRLRAYIGAGVAAVAVILGLVVVDPGGTATATPPPTTACPVATPHVPDGPDGMGGCWPGPKTTGVPAGVALTDYTGPCDIWDDNIVIDSKTINCGSMLVYGHNVTIKNSKINGPINTNTSTWGNHVNPSLTITDSEVDGGTDHSQAIGLHNITLLRVNVYGNQHAVHCNTDCDIRDSWLHDTWPGGAAQDWHQNGFISNGGSDFVVKHNTTYCTGGCTADIAFIPDGDVTNAVVDGNLLMASPDSAYCLYPSSSHPSKSGVVQQMKVTNNVFGRGANGKCATYGPVYGWDAPNTTPGKDGYGNVWSNNKYADGTPING